MNQKDKQLIKKALSNTFGEKIIGELGEYEFLRNVECDGKINQGRAIQLVTDYIIWSHACPKIYVTEHAFIKNHPFQQFINDNKELIAIVPDVITHYIEVQGWSLSPTGVQKEYVDYIPKIITREVNIE